MTHDEFAQALDRELAEIRELLLAKNAAYGNSALDPVRIFARGVDTVAQIDVRIDDKLSRLARGDARGRSAVPEDTHLDLLGYLLLRRIAVRLPPPPPRTWQCRDCTRSVSAEGARCAECRAEDSL